MSNDTSLDIDMLNSLSKKPTNDQFKTQLGTLDRIKQKGEVQGSVIKVLLEEIKIEDQVRESPVSEDAIINLAQSMESVGLLQPITVSPLPDIEKKSSNKKYRLEVGETRFRAASLLSWKDIQVNIVSRPEDVDRLRNQLVENIQRNNLNPIEVANGIEGIKKGYELLGKKTTYSRIAEELGMTSSNISEYISLLKIDEAIKDLILSGKIKDRRAAILIDEINCLSVKHGAIHIRRYEKGDGASRAELKKVLLSIKNEDIKEDDKAKTDKNSYYHKREPAIKVDPERIDYIVEGKLITGKSVRGTLIKGWLDEESNDGLTKTLWIKSDDGEVIAIEKITALYQKMLIKK